MPAWASVSPGTNSQGAAVKHCILLVDDSKFIRRANELALIKAGYSVLSAGDGEEGLRVAREKLPDLIVLDMMLPKLSGPQLLDILKKDVQTQRIPVIVLSSLPQKNAEKLKQGGAAAYFEKATLGVENGSAGLIHAVGSVLHASEATAASPAR
jgi:two-component system, cell cycle response regulator DivK